MARRRQEIGLAEAALRGAVAGLVGGLAALAADALAERRVLTARGSTRQGWSRLARRVARRTGSSLGERQQVAAGIAAHLFYSASLGALYGVLQYRFELPDEAQALA